MARAVSADTTSSTFDRPAEHAGGVPPYFGQQSDVLKDLISAVVSALNRVKKGQSRSFGSALYRALADMDQFNLDAGAQLSGEMNDWHSTRLAEFQARDARSRRRCMEMRRGGMIVS